MGNSLSQPIAHRLAVVYTVLWQPFDNKVQQFSFADPIPHTLRPTSHPSKPL